MKPTNFQKFKKVAKTAAVLGLASVLVAGCGKSDKNKVGSNATNPTSNPWVGSNPQATATFGQLANQPCPYGSRFGAVTYQMNMNNGSLTQVGSIPGGNTEVFFGKNHEKGHLAALTIINNSAHYLTLSMCQVQGIVDNASDIRSPSVLYYDPNALTRSSQCNNLNNFWIQFYDRYGYQLIDTFAGACN